MPKAKAQTEQWIALLGRRDTPTDGIEDYCSFLGRALTAQNVRLKSVRVPWFERGWLRALFELWQESRFWTENWVLLQYAAMAWSQRGFPIGAVVAAKLLRRRAARIAVVFHEPFRQGGARWIDRLRGLCQDWVVRSLYKTATTAIFADPLEKIRWLRAGESKASFVPIGANIPEVRSRFVVQQNRNGRPRTVAVFCLSDVPNRTQEINDVFRAMQFAREQGLKTRVVFLGRGTNDAKQEIEQLFGPSAIDVLNLGLQSAEEVSRILSESDAMLCVRGSLYLRRGSAIAAIACGLPVVAYGGAAEGTPLEEAGIVLVPPGDSNALGAVLTRILTDRLVWDELNSRSVIAYRKYFSWDVIADRMQRAFQGNHISQ